MSLGDHLDDLRRRLMLGMIGPLVMAVVMLFFGKELVGLICVPLLLALEANGQNAQVYAVTAIVGFSVYLKVSLISGLILGLPWLAWQMWKFISLGLYPHERRFVTLLVPGSAFLTVTGVAFMYFIMLPVMLMFLVSFTTSYPKPDIHDQAYFNWVFGLLVVDKAESEGAGDPDDPDGPVVDSDDPAPIVQIPSFAEDPEAPVEGQVWLKTPERQLRMFIGGAVRVLTFQKEGLLSPEIRIGDYIGMVVWLALAFTLTFQLPLAMYLLAATRLVRFERMARIRKYAFFTSFVLGAALTPQDPFSMILMALPMYGLYELGLVLARIAGRKAEAADAEA